ncbi:hypothetical protein SOPP22_15975 [Shewanella sp. OPT22]|nr:hypothetical protein SOPP22_15975 [Shewanella sp. OPT22]
MPLFIAPQSIVGTLKWDSQGSSRSSKVLEMDNSIKTQVKDALARAKRDGDTHTTLELSFSCKTNTTTKSKVYKITFENQANGSIRVRRVGFKAFIARMFCFGGKLSHQMSEQLHSYCYPESNRRIVEHQCNSSDASVCGGAQSEKLEINDVSRENWVKGSVAERQAYLHKLLLAPPKAKITPRDLLEQKTTPLLPENMQVQPFHFEFLLSEKEDDGKTSLCDRFLYLGLLLGLPTSDIIARIKAGRFKSDDNNGVMLDILTCAIEKKLNCAEFFYILKLSGKRSFHVQRAIDRLGIDFKLSSPDTFKGNLPIFRRNTSSIELSKLVSVEIKDERNRREHINVLEILKPWAKSIAAAWGISDRKAQYLKEESENNDYLLLALILNEIENHTYDFSWEKLRAVIQDHHFLKGNKKLLKALDAMCKEVANPLD